MSDGMRGVLVTGASRGIGRAVATAFATRGDRIAVHYGSATADAEETLRALPGDGHVLIGGDLSDPAAVTRVVSEAVSGMGAIDVLVNNAALAPTPVSRHAIAEVAYEDWVAIWRRPFEVNLFAAANLSWAFARHLLSRSAPGSIVNVGSRGAFRGEPEHP